MVIIYPFSIAVAIFFLVIFVMLVGGMAGTVLYFLNEYLPTIIVICAIYCLICLLIVAIKTKHVGYSCSSLLISTASCYFIIRGIFELASSFEAHPIWTLILSFFFFLFSAFFIILPFASACMITADCEDYQKDTYDEGRPFVFWLVIGALAWIANWIIL